MSATPHVILASGSPRRRAILASAGVAFVAAAPDIDDALVRVPSSDPSRMVMALAWFKARQVARSADAWPAGPRWVLAADTMCFRGAEPVGKPADERDARAMLGSFEGGSHQVVTGVCLLDRAEGRRHLLSDSARVTVGRIGAAELDAYLASGEWRGKAGAYNYADRASAGWPLACEGDPETVMGLPSRLVLPIIGRRGAA